jgi:integrase
LHPVEIEKGRRAAENYLSSFRNDETRAKAEEALETLATVISAGKCDSLDFPWQQVRSYHEAAALTILKEKGAPARVEALLCRRDSTRSYRMVPESYPPRQVQKIRSTLTKLIAECCELGFVSDDAPVTETRQPNKAKTAKAAKKKSASGRSLSTGELRALMANCAAAQNAEGLRDAVLFALVHRGLKIAEITALRVDSVGVSSKTGLCNIVVRPASGGRARRIELTNEELIYLEDWLDYRGSGDGALLCTVGRANKIEGKRLTLAALKQVCETRGREAEVQPFTPNDLSRSAADLIDHRKATRRKRAKNGHDAGSAVDEILFNEVESSSEADRGETILFPFLGLGI